MLHKDGKLHDSVIKNSFMILFRFSVRDEGLNKELERVSAQFVSREVKSNLSATVCLV